MKWLEKFGTKNLLQVGRLLEAYVLRRGVCSMSGSIYDTAWVSMVPNPGEREAKWLFPSSFECILDSQSENGGWEGDLRSQRHPSVVRKQRVTHLGDI